jgi:predicted MPP superfamily phosphohydrolase
MVPRPSAPPAALRGSRSTRTSLGTAGRLAGLTAAAGTVGLVGAYAESRAYVLRRFSLPVLPAGARPLRVLHLSDLHLTPRTRRERDWVRGLAALEPDLVVNTGDNLAHVDAVPVVLDALGELLDRPGVFVLGSNDYFAPRPKNPARYLVPKGRGRRIAGVPLPTGRLVDGLRRGGWVDLDNTRAELTVGGLRLSFVGVDDPHLSYDRFPPASGGDVTTDLHVGVAHAPYQRVLDAMVDDGAEVLLAGHTHGGQLRLPGIGALVTNCDLDRARARGVSRWWHGAGARPASRTPPGDAAWLHVSAGLGTSPYSPVRFCCRPEASLLTLMARDR